MIIVVMSQLSSQQYKMLKQCKTSHTNSFDYCLKKTIGCNKPPRDASNAVAVVAIRLGTDPTIFLCLVKPGVDVIRVKDCQVEGISSDKAGKRKI